MCGLNPRHTDPKGLVQVLQNQGSFHGIQGFMPLISRWLLHVLEEGVEAELVLHLQEHMCFSSAKGHALQNHILLVELEAQREVDVGGQADDGIFPLGGIILKNLRDHG